MTPRYLLRTVPANGVSGGQELDGATAAPTITWPTEIGAEVVCTDWDPAPRCGGGIHGYLYGEGCGRSLSQEDDARWLVVEVPEGEPVVRIEDGSRDYKCKAPRVVLRYSGTQDDAIAWLVEHAPGHAIYRAQVTAGVGGTATAGLCGTATAGEGGTATAGLCGTATAGEGGTATAGDGGIATAGDGGTATAGAYGTATAGLCGTATAGDGGEIRIRWHDGRRYRLAVGYVGEDGIEADVPYVVCDGKLAAANAVRSGAAARKAANCGALAEGISRHAQNQANGEPEV